MRLSPMRAPLDEPPDPYDAVRDDIEAVRQVLRRDREPYAGPYGDPAAATPVFGDGTAGTSQVPRSYAFC